MTDWQLIETYAEGDGEVIVWNGVFVFPAWLNHNGWHDSRNQDRDDYPEVPQPTHWMPYPEPPAPTLETEHTE